MTHPIPSTTALLHLLQNTTQHNTTRPDPKVDVFPGATDGYTIALSTVLAVRVVPPLLWNYYNLVYEAVASPNPPACLPPPASLVSLADQLSAKVD